MKPRKQIRKFQEKDIVPQKTKKLKYGVLSESISIREKDVIHRFTREAKWTNNYMPHEWIFVKILLAKNIVTDPKFAQKFLAFIIQYYPDYKWSQFDLSSIPDTVYLELALNDYRFKKKIIHNQVVENYDLAMKMGEIATDFCIRFLDYSLIDCCGQKIIVTSRNNCDKRYEDLLANGYTLHRSSKVWFKELPEEILKAIPFAQYLGGHFTKSPVLPTSNDDYDFEEIIESSDGEYRKVLKY